MTEQYKIVVIGAGFAGSILARQLLKYTDSDISIYDKCESIESSLTGTGLNLNPNALKSLKHIDPELEAELRSAGLPRSSMKAETIDGQEIFHETIYDGSKDSLADNTGLRIRWADAYSKVRDGLPIHYAHEVVHYQVDETKDRGSITVTLRNTDTGEELVIKDVDCLVGADGRYSRIRSQDHTPETTYNSVSNFRLLIPDTSGDLFEDMELIYNTNPDLEKIKALNLSEDFNHAAHSIPRIGIMKMPKVANREQMLYIFGNFGLDLEIPEEAKTAEGLDLLYRPVSDQLSPKGRYILDVLNQHAQDLHWARMQKTEQKFTIDKQPVLLLGDAAHAIVPTLGQGATLAIEDACVASGIMIEAIKSKSFNAETLEQIAEQRIERRQFVSDVSDEASTHLMIQNRPVQQIIEEEQAAWKDKNSAFRERMRAVWSHSPVVKLG